MLKGFKEFILRGNVVDLAVGVVIGAAFGSVVNALVKDILTPLIGVLVKAPDFSALIFKVNGSSFLLGDFINSVIAFLLVAAAVYFFVVVPINKLVDRMKRSKVPADPTSKKCGECCSEIPMQAKRCAFCTSQVS